MIFCQKCKTAHATIHLTSVDQCRKREYHFCEDCARTSDLPFPLALKPIMDRARLMCPDCRHVNQEGWSYCSACGSQRPP